MKNNIFTFYIVPFFVVQFLIEKPNKKIKLEYKILFTTQSKLQKKKASPF